MSEKNLGLLSLFCGPGGLDSGFKKAGFHTEIAFDVDKDCVATFRKNHGPIAHQADVRGLTLPKLDKLAEKRVSPVGVIGGPPCQSFSISNVHQSDDDERHSLPSAYASLLRRLNKRSPISFFLFENVPGLKGKKHAHRYELFTREFKRAGFELFDTELDAQHFGVPQERRRLFIVGINRDLHPDAKWTWPAAEKEIHTVRDTIEDLPDPIFNQKGLDPSEIPVHPNHWAMVPRSKKFSTKGALIEGQAWGRSFRTLKWDEPSWTVAYGNREVHVHPNGKRRLSMYEAMLLQSFPRDYVLVGNISAQTRLVSEAVPPRLGWHLAKQIKSVLFE